MQERKVLRLRNRPSSSQRGCLCLSVQRRALWGPGALEPVTPQVGADLGENSARHCGARGETWERAKEKSRRGGAAHGEAPTGPRRQGGERTAAQSTEGTVRPPGTGPPGPLLTTAPPPAPPCMGPFCAVSAMAGRSGHALQAREKDMSRGGPTGRASQGLRARPRRSPAPRPALGGRSPRGPGPARSRAGGTYQADPTPKAPGRQGGDSLTGEAAPTRM